MVDIDDEKKKDVIENFVKIIVEGYEKSGYPSRTFSLSHFFDEAGFHSLEIHIRTPSIRPAYIDEKYESYLDRNTACPSIERILLPEWMRHQGFFSSLVNALGALSHVDAVCVSHVTNHEFSQYLEKNEDWIRLEHTYPLNSPVAQFYKSEPPTYCHMFVDDC